MSEHDFEPDYELILEDRTLARHGDPADVLREEGHVERRGRKQEEHVDWSEARARGWVE